jgi:hypothetical protein
MGRPGLEIDEDARKEAKMLRSRQLQSARLTISPAMTDDSKT